MRFRLLAAFTLPIWVATPFSAAPICPEATYLVPDRYASGGPFGPGTVGDLNGDFLDDLVLWGPNADKLTVRLNDGLGRFGAFLTSGFILSHGYELLVEDIDGDDVGDVVVVGEGQAAFVKGQGNGTFAAPLVSPVGVPGSPPPDAELGDFDGDGNWDLLIRWFQKITLARGNGSGAFALSDEVALSSAGPPAIEDLDGDGIDDVVVATIGSEVTVLLGRPDGTLSPPDGFVAAPEVLAVTTAEMTGDGIPDIVAAAGSQLAILPGVGDGTFLAASTHSIGVRLERIRVLDADGDGRLDIVGVQDEFFSKIHTILLYGNGAGGFDAPLRLLTASAPNDVFLSDLDSTLELDLVLPDGSGAGVVRSLGGRQYQAPVSPLPAMDVRAYGVADLNGDGLDDAIAGGVGELRAALGSPSRLLVDTRAVSASVGEIVGGDFNEDGFEDVLTANFGEWRLYPGDAAASLAASTVVATGTGGNALLAGDFDGDGHLDFLDAHTGSTPLMKVFYGDGQGGFPGQLAVNPSVPLVDFAAADVTGDGKTDLVALAEDSGQLENRFLVWISTGRAFAAPLETGLPLRMEGITAGDADGDAVPDVVTAGGGMIVIARGNLSGTFAIGPIVGVADPKSFVRIADVNVDGIPDLLASGPRLSVYLGLGGGTFDSPEVEFSSVSRPVFGDFDGNGTSDLLGSSGTFGNEIAAVFNARLAVSLDVSEALCLGSEATLRARAAGYGPVSYQWRKDGVPLTDGGSISGATTDTLTIDPVASGDAGDYDVVVTDLCTSVTSETGEVSVVSQPPAPAITAPDTVAASTTGLTASVPDQPGHAYTWTLTGGTITAGQGTSQITFTSGPAGTTMQVSVEDVLGNCAAASSTRAVQVQFADVALGDPYSPFIHTIARNGVTAGCGGGNYCPDLNVTRAQMAIFLLISKNGALYTPPPATGLIFLDVPANAFAAAFIEAIAAAQVTSGCGGGNYCPDFFIRRSEMAVFLLRTLEGPTYNPPPATGTVFGDVAAGDFAAAWIEEIADRGITGGCGGGNFCPNAFVSRAQMAVFLVLTFQLE